MSYQTQWKAEYNEIAALHWKKIFKKICQTRRLSPTKMSCRILVEIKTFWEKKWSWNTVVSISTLLYIIMFFGIKEIKPNGNSHKGRF